MINRIKRNKEQQEVRKLFRQNNHWTVDNFPVIATGALCNTVQIDDEESDGPFYQNRIFCFSIDTTHRLKSSIDKT